MSRHRYFFLILSSIVAVAVLWGVWRHLATHLPCCDALSYGEFGASIREVGLWGGFLGSHYRTFGFPLYLSLVGGELSLDTVWGTTSGSLFAWNVALFLLAAWFFVISAAKIDRRFFFPLAAGVLLNPFLLVYVPHVLSESLSIIVALVAAAFFFRVVEKADRYVSVFLCAVLAGYLMEIRLPNLGISLALLVSMLVVFFYHVRRGAVPKRQLLLATTVAFVGFALPVAIQVSINWVVHGQLKPFSVVDMVTGHMWWGTYHLKYGTGLFDDRWQAIRSFSPWVSDPLAFKGAVASFYMDHPWTALKTCIVHLYSAVNYDFFGVYLHEPEYVKYSWHQLLSSTVQYFGVLGAAATLLPGLHRRRWSGSGLLVLLGWLVVVFYSGIIAVSHTATRFGFAIITILSFAAMAWLLKSSRRSLLANGGSFVGLALYLFLSAELSGWIAGHTVPRIPGAPAVEVPASISALRERYKYELLVSRYREEGQIDKAVELCKSEAQRDLDRTDSCVSARVDWALVLKSEHKTAEAVAQLKAVMELAPNRSRPFRILADIYREWGQDQEALRLYQATLRIDLRDLAARIHLVAVYRKLGRSEEAVEELKVASRFYPKRSWPVRALADIYRERGDEKLALAHCRKAIQVEANDIPARVLLGRIYEQYGKREQAMRAYRDVLAIDPDHGAAKTALSRLLQ